ncbi:ABC transporter ATP-binding protein [Spiroplasma chinense]|uniref:ABC transporter ATP-binding protein n=1 Tax=Spiroplasma chinense TaxID=216932 RepID=A0A5B9Y515_9MOLU|nr:ABC transporter ATP-binding protein [Spiroplasma chinense]QEH62258.1 ABC transporter ATP-binding protein [Spiroplasma chinense]
MKNILEIKKLYKDIRNKKILHDINFEIKEGEFVGFVGDNGAGKTTTIRLIFNELKINQGEVLYYGESVFENQNLKNLAFFPDSNNIPLNFTVNEYIKYICELSFLQNYEKKIKELCEFFNFEKHVDKKFKELSAGMKKKALLISILVIKPKMIILDEPTANLDVKSKIEFMNILKLLNENGITIMVTSHIIEELEKNINKLILIDKGKILYKEKYDPNKESIQQIYSKLVPNEKLDIEKLKNIVEIENER